MPNYDERIVMDPTLVDLGPTVRSQLRDFVDHIASLYQDNTFHTRSSFEHASHVAMSASKLLKHITIPTTLNTLLTNQGKA